MFGLHMLMIEFRDKNKLHFQVTQNSMVDAVLYPLFEVRSCWLSDIVSDVLPDRWVISHMVNGYVSKVDEVRQFSLITDGVQRKRFSHGEAR